MEVPIFENFKISILNNKLPGRYVGKVGLEYMCSCNFNMRIEE